MNIHRYDKSRRVGTQLDSREDVLSWIRGLRSKGLTSDVLKEIHRVRGKNEIEKRGTAISEHAETAVNLLEQGFSGPIETSFLPLYYGLLNLSKIYIICSNQFSLLEKNRFHGAKIETHSSQQRGFLKDVIVLKPKGTIPLFYKTITGQTISDSIKIKLNEIYPFINDISYEYEFLYRTETPLQRCDLKFIKDDANGHKLQLTIEAPLIKNSTRSSSNQFLKDFSKIKDNTYQTAPIKGGSEEVRKQLISNVKRFLFYETSITTREDILTYLPISRKKVLLPEELPILLAFFHLSNIVRYNPELLFELKNSPEWGMIQTLSRHGVFRFLLLFWANFQQETFSIFRS